MALRNKRVAIDIDGTIFSEKSERERTDAVPIDGAIDAINSLYESGYTVVLYTARTYRELERTIKQLVDNDVKYHHLVVGKPVADVFVDDRAVVLTRWPDTLKAITRKLNPPLRHLTVLVTSAGSTNGVNIIKVLQEQTDYQIDIVAADTNSNAPGLYLADHYAVTPETYSTRYLDTLLGVCEQHGVDILIPSYSGEMAFYCDNCELFNRIGIRMMISSRSSLDVCSDKTLMASFLKSRSIRYPDMYQSSSGLPFPVFIKSNHGSGSRHARVVNNRTELDYHLMQIPSPIIQEYINGEEYTVNILSDYNGEVVGAVPIRRTRVRNGLSVEAEVVMDNDIIETSKKIVESLSLVGPSNVQVMKKGNEIVCIEINPRFASGTLPLAVGAGFNIPLLMIKLMLGEPVEGINIRDGMTMTRYLSWIIRGGTY